MAHVLVIGGTGMLREVSLFLAKHDNTVSVVALEAVDLENLKQEAQIENGRINTIEVDYCEGKRFQNAVKAAMEAHGPITLAIAWMHTSALPDAANLLVDVISEHSPVCRYFQVLPSSGITGKDRRFLENPFPQHNKILYRKIILGFRVDQGMRAYLSNKEIASGVIKALRDDAKDAVLGTVDSLEDQSGVA